MQNNVMTENIQKSLYICVSPNIQIIILFITSMFLKTLVMDKGILIKITMTQQNVAFGHVIFSYIFIANVATSNMLWCIIVNNWAAFTIT